MQLAVEEALFKERLKELSTKLSGRSGRGGYTRLVTKVSFSL